MVVERYNAIIYNYSSLLNGLTMVGKGLYYTKANMK